MAEEEISACAKENWKAASNEMQREVFVSSAFNTLRSTHEDIIVKPSDLRVLELIGEGAFAIVQKSCLTTKDGNKRIVAVKRMKDDFDSDDLDDFIREVEVLKKLSHSGIVSFIGIGYENAKNTEIPRKIFIVEEYSDGGTLKRLVQMQMMTKKKSMYSTEDAFQWLLQIAKGLAYMHSSNPMVIHRDLKLDNILLTTNPLNSKLCVKIADFGLSSIVFRKKDMLRRSNKNFESLNQDLQRLPSPQLLRLNSKSSLIESSKRSNSSMASSFKSRSSYISSYPSKNSIISSLNRKNTSKYDLSGKIGSMMYMAPEVYKFENYNEKVDVFSFGMMAYELLSQKLNMTPYQLPSCNGSVEAYVELVSQGYRPEIPEEWDESWKKLVSDCWSQNPSDRSHMAVVVKRIEEIINNNFSKNNSKKKQQGFKINQLSFSGFRICVSKNSNIDSQYQQNVITPEDVTETVSLSDLTENEDPLTTIPSDINIAGADLASTEPMESETVVKSRIPKENSEAKSPEIVAGKFHQYWARANSWIPPNSFASIVRDIILVFLGLNLVFAIFKVFRKFLSPKASRKRIVNKNRELVEELVKYLPSSRDELTPKIIWMLRMKTGFSSMEIFRKYLWFVLRERKFDQEAVNDLVYLKEVLQMAEIDVATALNERAQRIYEKYGSLMLNTEGMTSAGIERKATCRSLFSKLLYLTENENLLTPNSEEAQQVNLRNIFGATEEDIEKLRIVSLEEVDINELEKMLTTTSVESEIGSNDE